MNPGLASQLKTPKTLKTRCPLSCRDGGEAVSIPLRLDRSDGLRTFLEVIMQPRTYASRRVSKVLVCFLLLLSAASLHSQTFRGGINGTISDQSGAVVLGAAVTATNNGTGVSLNAITSSGGEFQFQDLPFGDLHHHRDRVGVQAREGEGCSRDGGRHLHLAGQVNRRRRG